MRATQSFEFLHAIARSSIDGDTIRLSPALIQPVAADDVAATLTTVATAAPAKGTIELAGPEAFPLDDLIRRYLLADEGPEPVRQVTTDPHARYFGTELTDASLTPGPNAHLGAISFVDWLNRRTPGK